MFDPVGPPSDGEFAGLVEQKTASLVHAAVEATSRQTDVAHPLAKQALAFTEVVADADAGNFLEQKPPNLFEIHEFGQQPAHRLGPGSGEISSECARVVFSTSAATG